MASFTDNKGREWSLALTVAAARRLEAYTAFPVTALYDPQRNIEALEAFRTSIGLPECLAWLLVKDRAEATGVSIDDFFQAIEGREQEVLFAFYYAIRARRLAKVTA